MIHIHERGKQRWEILGIYWCCRSCVLAKNDDWWSGYEALLKEVQESAIPLDRSLHRHMEDMLGRDHPNFPSFSAGGDLDIVVIPHI